MWKVFLGIAVTVLGVVAFIIGLQYASFSMPPGLDEATREKYGLYSSLFGYSSYVLFIVGVGLTIWAVRKQNRLSRHESKQRDAA